MSKTEKMNIGVFFGSRSPEHDVSIITGQLIISGLKALGFKTVPVYLSRKGEWFLGSELGKLQSFTDTTITLESEKFNKFYLDLEKSRQKMIFRRKGAFGGEVVVDLAFPALHGSYGEDGTIQGLFEMLDIPYVGCSLTASAICMDKVLTKQIYQLSGIPTAKFIFFNDLDWEQKKNDLIKDIKNLHFPLFVKPARLGSSIGINKVKEEKELEFAIEVALHYDSKVLVEEAVENVVDATVALLGNSRPKTSLIQESVFEGSELFSYEEKYLKSGGAQLGKAKANIFIPARIDQEVSQAISDMAIRIFKIFECSGTARVDFLFDKKSGKFYANEINTLPGTLYHHLWQKSGVDLPELLEELINLALERHSKKKKLTYTFDSEILRRIGGSSKLQFGKGA